VPDEAGEIVGEIGHADLGPGAGDTDRADEQAHPEFLLRKDMLDERTDFRSAALARDVASLIGRPFGFNHRDSESSQAVNGEVFRGVQLLDLELKS
jgi:hypothetical protein